MADPLSNIPPLIPLPSSTPKPNSEDLVDRFATLFSPPTPRATPTGSPKPDQPLPQPRHIRQESDDFGSFVSIPSAQAPLVENKPSHLRGWSFFEEAKARDQKKRESLLAEMDRPLFTDTPSAASVNHLDIFPTQTQSPVPETGQLVDHPDEEREPAQTRSAGSSPRPAPKRSPTLTMASRPPSLAPPLTSNTSVSSLDALESPGAVDNNPRLASSLESASKHSRSYTDFSQVAPITRQRRSSHSNTIPPSLSSYSTLSALSAKWMANLLSASTPQPPPPTSSPPAAMEHHSSPFAPKLPYVPPSGAPGYTGEREGWDKDGRWYGALERDLTAKSPPSSRPPIPASFVSTTPSTSKSPSPRPMGALMTTALPPLSLSGLQPTTTPILTLELASALRVNLPPLRRLKENWQLLYSLDQHGVSLSTLYSRCDRLGSGLSQIKRVGEFASARDEFGLMGNRSAAFGGTGGVTAAAGELGTILVIQDSNGAIFGAWLGERLRAGEGGYFGSGESFLWKQKSLTDIEIFRWTGKNDYVALCESDYISFGGGDGSYGLYLDSALFEGSSAPCPTFENAPLCYGVGKGMHKFECVGLEVWGV